MRRHCSYGHLRGIFPFIKARIARARGTVASADLTNSYQHIPIALHHLQQIEDLGGGAELGEAVSEVTGGMGLARVGQGDNGVGDDEAAHAEIGKFVARLANAKVVECAGNDGGLNPMFRKECTKLGTCQRTPALLDMDVIAAGRMPALPGNPSPASQRPRSNRSLSEMPKDGR